MIVEDSPVQRGILEDLIAELLPDATIRAVDSAVTALVGLGEADDPDLILTDFNMPGKNGVLFIREAREKGYKGKVFVISTEKSQEIMSAAREAGADGYLHKPYNQEEVANLLGIGGRE